MDVVQEHIPAFKPCAGIEINAAGHILETAAQHIPAHVARICAAEGQTRSLEAVYHKAAAVVVRPPAVGLIVAVTVVSREFKRAGHCIFDNVHRHSVSSIPHSSSYSAVLSLPPA